MKWNEKGVKLVERHIYHRSATDICLSVQILLIKPHAVGSFHIGCRLKRSQIACCSDRILADTLNREFEITKST